MKQAVRNLLGIVSTVVRAVDEGARADAVLGRVLRVQREMDEPARAFAHRATMALFRWWGWVEPLGRPSLERSVALALLLERPPVAEGDATLAQIASAGRVDLSKVGRPSEGDDLAARGTWLAKACDKKEAPSPQLLFPDWLQSHLPTADASLLEWLQRPPSLWIRAQGPAASALGDDLRAAGFVANPHPRIERALEVVSGGDLYRHALFHAGRFELQDVSSQAVCVIAAPKRGERWWDVCAGGGGKSLALADRMAGGGTVLATDERAKRLEELTRRARRGGFSNIQPLSWDGKQLPRRDRRRQFDGVLVDAPCSASGTWRRNPDARWRVEESGVKRLASIARGILDRASDHVRPGGRLVYATCSLSRLEDEDVVEGFLSAHPAFTRDPFDNPLTASPTTGEVRLLPSDGGGDLMYVARLRREATPATSPCP